MICPKCGSSDYSIRLDAHITSSRKVIEKRFENKIECDRCGFVWMWE